MTSDPVRQLEELLLQGGIAPRLDPDRIARSSFYDAAYRTCIVGLTVRGCGATSERGAELNHQKLRLFQFVAVHRGLLGPLQGWVAAFRSDRPVSLFEWAGLPSGYATDRAYDQVLRYLVATGQLVRQGERIVLLKDAFVDRLVQTADSQGLFQSEVEAIAAMALTKVTMEMLGA